MPPPNVTGSLHVVMPLHLHYKILLLDIKKNGWVLKHFGNQEQDHAGIATQNVVEKQLLAEGTTKEEIGRKSFKELGFKKDIWKYCSSNEKIRCYPAWKRERF